MAVILSARICTVLFSFPLIMAGQSVAPAPALDGAHFSPTLYFASKADESAAWVQLQRRVEEKIKQLPHASVAQLANGLDGADELFVALQRHLAYIKVLALENSENHAFRESGNQLAAAQAKLEAAVDQRLRHIPAADVSGLGRYAYLARQLQGDSAHAFTPDAESYRSTVTTPLEASLSDSYDKIINSLGSGDHAIHASDTESRRAALSSRNASWGQAAPVVATLLGTLVETENRDAAAEGYPDAAERKYQSLGLNGATVAHMLAAVQSQADAYRHYEQIRAAHAAKVLKVSETLADEQDIPSAASNPISLAEAREMILVSLRPLGADYTQRFAALLDPSNGRLDLAGGTHRADTGTSINAYDAPTGLYYEGYKGSLSNVSKIAHEGGHAVHRELMNSSKLPIYEREGPHYLFEGYAIFNELLLLDQASKSATTPSARDYALERFLAKIALELFVSAEETAFEKELYQQASGHAMLDREKVDVIFQDSIRPYEFYPMSDVGASRNWMRKSLLFEDPNYLVNYLYASVIAVALFDKAHTDPDFAAKYSALQRRGFDAAPKILLKTMGIDLDDPHLIEGAARLFSEKTNELQTLYADK